MVLLKVLDSDSLLAGASFPCYSEPLLAGENSGNGAMKSEGGKQAQGLVKWPGRFIFRRIKPGSDADLFMSRT